MSPCLRERIAPQASDLKGDLGHATSECFFLEEFGIGGASLLADGGLNGGEEFFRLLDDGRILGQRQLNPIRFLPI